MTNLEVPPYPTTCHTPFEFIHQFINFSERIDLDDDKTIAS